MADIDSILKALRLTESNDGKNIKHKTITYGAQKGDAAIGNYGLMPNTVREVAGSSADPDIQSLVDLPSDDIKSVLEQTPELQDKVAKELLVPILDRQGGDPAKAAYAWRWGHNLPAADVDSKDYMDKEHVQRFLRNLDKSTPRVAPAALSPAMPPSIPDALNPNVDMGKTMASRALSKQDLTTTGGSGAALPTVDWERILAGGSPVNSYDATGTVPVEILPPSHPQYPDSIRDPIGQAQSMVDPTGTMQASPTGVASPIAAPPRLDNPPPIPDPVVAPQARPPEESVSETVTAEQLAPTPPIAPEPPVAELTLPEEPDTTDADFRAAQAERNRLTGMLMMARGGERIGSAIAGTKSDANYLSELTGLVNAPVEDMLTLNKLKSGKLQNAQMKRTLDLEKQKDDPTSEISRVYREAARRLASHTEALKGLPLGDNLTAGELEKFSPILFNVITQDIARQSRMEVAKVKEQEQKTKAEDKQHDTSKKVYGEVVDKVQGNRKSPQVQLAEKNLLFIKNAEELLQSYPDLNKMPEDQVNTLRSELARIATGSVATAHAMKEIETKTLVSNWNKFMSKVSNKPQGSELKEFLKNNVRYLGGLKRVQQEVISDNVKKLYNSRKDRMTPEDRDQFQQDYADILNPKLEYSPQAEAGITAVMEHNKVDRETAIKALRDAGKL